MTRYLAACLSLAALSLLPFEAAADPVFATVPAVYDTVDAVEVWGSRIVVTGIVAGESARSERLYRILDEGTSTSSAASANRCDRLALLAIEKPGKYQFATTRPPGSSAFGCKLILRAP